MAHATYATAHENDETYRRAMAELEALAIARSQSLKAAED
jgi:hypothetical protein